MKNRCFLAFCILFSLCLHGFALFLLKINFLIFPSQTTLITPPVSDPLARGKILKEAFQSFSSHAPVEEVPEKKNIPQKISIPNLLIQNKEPPFQQIETKNSSLLSFHSPLKFDDLVTANSSLSLLSPPPLFSELPPLNLLLPTMPAPEISPQKESLSDPQSHPEIPLVSRNILSTTAPESLPVAFKQRELDTKEFSDPGAIKRASLSIPSPIMPAFPTLDELDTASYSDWFDFELICTPKEDNSGYLFALTLIPRIEMDFSTFRQHYIFLIDRSNSIQKDRLAMTKSAVLKALEELSPHDTFNILVFDNKAEKLFPSPKKADDLSLSLAKAFLNKITLGSFFSLANLYNPLTLALPQRVEEDELYNVILLTDGEALSKKGTLRSILDDWTHQARGTVSLFALGMNSDPHLSSLQAITSFNKGWVTPSQTNRGLKRKLLKVMKNIHTPLAKNLMCRVIPLSPTSKIEIFPHLEQTPNLYLNHPFVILGSTQTMDNFILFVQGRLNNRWLNIKKNVSFLSAKQGSLALKREWALRSSYKCYEHYFKENNTAYLNEAREILAAYDLTPILP